MKALVSSLMVMVGLTVGYGCERFEKPSAEDCLSAVTSLINHTVSASIEEKFPNKGAPDLSAMAGEFAKGVGATLLTEAMIDKRKIAWCEVNMSKLQTNCLRAAQTKSAALECGVRLDGEGHLTK